MGNKILVPLDVGYGRAVEGLGKITGNVMDFMRNPQSYKLVLFTGGEDVSPFLYGENSSRFCQSNTKRDLYEMEIYEVAQGNNIKMTGICRGAQFLNVLAGGRMMHHVENHAGCLHGVKTSRGELITVNSLHHQMIVPNENVRVIAWSEQKLSPIYLGNKDKMENWRGFETEAILIPDMLSCGVQWHPECMPKDSDGYQFYHRMVKDLLSMDINNFITEYTTKTRTAALEI